MTNLRLPLWDAMRGRRLMIVFASLTLAACGSSGQAPHAPPPHAPAATLPATTGTSAPITPAQPGKTERFHSVRLGFYIDYPADMALSPDFDSRYMANGAWKAYAPSGSTGTAIVMLTLPGSNDVTAGELRIGVSNKPGAVQRCARPPGAVRPGTQRTATLNGTRFTTWHAADAAMSHYLKVHSYRTVHGGYCYAIDLMVMGTNPQVYSPPKTPPFSREQAFARLHQALQGFHFTH